MKIANTLLSLENINKTYFGHSILTNVSLSIKEGDSLVLRGANGSGKSTLLKIMAGLISPTSGKRVITSPNLNLSYMPDKISSIRMTSTEYLTHMGKISGLSNVMIRERIAALHHTFQLEQNMSITMKHYSKGMLQKVNIMQAVLTRPQLLIIDEPFSGLDVDAKEQLYLALRTILEEGTAIVCAIHDSDYADYIPSSTYLLQQGTLHRQAVKNEQTIHEHICYKFKVKMNDDQLQHMNALFPDVNWIKEQNDLISSTVLESHYDKVLEQLLHRKVELYLVERREMKE